MNGRHMIAVDLERVDAAAEAIPGVFLNTPQYRSDGISRALGLDVILKVETVNPVGSLAGRGAQWWFDCHPDAHRIICPSTDDFGVAMAHAGRERGVEVDLFGPVTSDRLKVDDLRRAGTTVRLDGRDLVEAAIEARRYASVVDAEFIDNSARPELVEGSATIAAELFEEAVEAGTVFVSADTGFVPVGIGGWLHQRVPRARVVGSVCGNQPAPVGAANSAIDQTVHIPDGPIREARRLLVRHEGLQVSRAGASPLAAAAMAARSSKGSKVIVVVGSRSLE